MKPMQMFNLRVLFFVSILVILSVHCQKFSKKDKHLNEQYKPNLKIKENKFINIGGNVSLNDTIEQNITSEETQDNKENMNETISLKTVNAKENVTSVKTQTMTSQIEFLNASTHISDLDIVNITQDETLSNSSESYKKPSTSCDCHVHHLMEPSKDNDKKELGKGKTKDQSKSYSKQLNKNDDDNLQDHVHVHSKGNLRHNHSKYNHIHSLNNQDLRRNYQNGHSNVKYKPKNTKFHNQIRHDHYEPSVSRQRHFKVQETHIHLNIQVSGRNEEDAKEKERHKMRVEQIKKEGLLEKDLTAKNEIPIFARCDMKTYNSGHNISGTVFLHQLPGQYLKVEVQLHGFSVQSNHTSTDIKEEKQFLNLSSNDISLNKQLHGFHVHEFGDSSKGCHSMGGHFNPEGVHHGYRNNSHGHVGDWGNIDVDMYGDSNSNFTVQAASLIGPNSILGRGIVVHSQRDDLGKGDSPTSKTTGDAGGRIACCNIVLTKPIH
ncbi:GATA zinc finger domain-containing protein 14-like isoform X2 [Biomphalaria glabrata]|uniref:GATA zinc finger domain-containing protein 14-like isoform X2 n=1 Tax=Biomphalaria glabrata TaxID=6526 RepID=A0A9W3A3Q8_BIOGL|nr:GATA zinc finger domain-containing protein 14-like isoform X2 [Biomphalaria glabrata]